MDGLVCGSPAQTTITQRLEDRQRHLTKELGNVTQALEALKKNPELQSLMDLITGVGY